MLEPWFIRYPERYDAELKRLAELGIDTTEDATVKSQRNIIRLTLIIQGTNSFFDFDDKTRDYTLVVVYPDLYPWFRAQVYAYDLNLPRHQHLLQKNLCLLPRGTRFWNAEEPLADLLLSQLTLVFSKGTIEDLNVVKEDPQEQAEPVSEYFISHASVLFDPESIAIKIPDRPFEILGRLTVGLPEDAPLNARMAVKEIYDTNGKSTFSLSPDVQKLFPKDLYGMLIRTAEVPPVSSDYEVLNWIRKLLGKEASLLTSKRKLSFIAATYDNVFGITFPEEVRKGEIGMGWIFLVSGLAVPPSKVGKNILGKSQQPFAYMAKPAYISSDSKKDRVPRLVPLSTKKVALFGLGALGGYTALELARSGVGELRILDFDIVDPPTTVRWPLGLSAAGLSKVNAIKKFINENYPSTKVVIEKRRLGDSSVTGSGSDVITDDRFEGDIVEKFVMGVDLLMDATAEEGINNFLSRQAFQMHVPYLCMYATPGAWGGVVMRYLPGITGCWACMKQWQKDNSELVPPSDAGGEVQPPGCGDTTFTGAGFDLQNVLLAGVRLAVSTLCKYEKGGYADSSWDWAVLKMVDQNGDPTPPTWIAQKLELHPNCPYHGYH